MELRGWTAHLFCFAHMAPKPVLSNLLKKNLEGLFWSSDGPAGTVPAAKHFQAHAQSWQDGNLAWTDSVSVSSPVTCTQSKAKLLWRCIPGELAMGQQKCTGLEHARFCGTVVQYVPFLGPTG